MRVFLLQNNEFCDGFVPTKSPLEFDDEHSPSYHFAVQTVLKLTSDDVSAIGKLKLEAMQEKIDNQFTSCHNESAEKESIPSPVSNSSKVSIIIGKVCLRHQYIGLKVDFPALDAFIDHKTGNGNATVELKFNIPKLPIEISTVSGKNLRPCDIDNGLYIARDEDMTIEPDMWAMLKNVYDAGETAKGSCTVTIDVSDSLEAFLNALKNQ